MTPLTTCRVEGCDAPADANLCLDGHIQAPATGRRMFDPPETPWDVRAFTEHLRALPWTELAPHQQREVLRWLDTQIALLGDRHPLTAGLETVRRTLRCLGDGGYDPNDAPDEEDAPQKLGPAQGG